MATAVLGAGGGTGLECVIRLLSLGGSVHAIVRDPSKYKGKFPEDPKVKVLAGDVTDRATLANCLEGCRDVVFAASGKGYWSSSSVDHHGVEKVVQASKAAGIEHIVLVSSMLVTPKNRWNPIRLMLNNIRWGLMDEKFKGEEVLRRSGVSYTVVRPGGLKQGPAGHDQLATGQGDKGNPSGSISRADVARFCVEALTNPGARNVTVEIMTDPRGHREAALQPDEYNRHLQQLFCSLSKDSDGR